jgi:RNA polymerase sigma factor for flagellar operon FliA
MAGMKTDRVRAYRRAEGTRTGDEREMEILRHLPLVQTVVDRVAVHLPPTVDRDDLFHAGVIGLIDAINRFDPSRNNAFSTYAVMRIRGQIIDDLRARDWVPRGARERARDWRRALTELGARHGRGLTAAELAAELGVPEDELPEIERGANLATMVSIDAPTGEDGDGAISAFIPDLHPESVNPARHLERDDLKQALADALRLLTPQERLVVKLYYFEELLLKEIAAVMGVTESRVCQIHGRVMGVLRSRLTRADAV